MLLKFFSLAVLVLLLPLLAFGEEEMEKLLYTAVCKGDPPTVDKFFQKAYECGVNVTSAEEKKAASECYKEVVGLDEPKTYKDHRGLLCKNLDDGKNWSTDKCEQKKLGSDAYNARDKKMTVSLY